MLGLWNNVEHGSPGEVVQCVQRVFEWTQKSKVFIPCSIVSSAFIYPHFDFLIVRLMMLLSSLKQTTVLVIIKESLIYRPEAINYQLNRDHFPQMMHTRSRQRQLKVIVSIYLLSLLAPPVASSPRAASSDLSPQASKVSPPRCLGLSDETK